MLEEVAVLDAEPAALGKRFSSTRIGRLLDQRRAHRLSVVLSWGLN